ncbi:hypothetical protein BDZ91DRAFT_784270 [Kalaharituber pfeilii]|nr:hypothetical protein BDZ91DRAFT_784270 [Kalaharituber pfeilii]
MASDQDNAIPTIHRQQFNLLQLPTTSVTIHPTRATVVRNIKDVVLKPGRNEIILHQLTPVADEDSVKITGRLTNTNGAGPRVLLIADTTIDLVKPPRPQDGDEGAKKKECILEEPDSDDDKDKEDVTVSDSDTPTLKSLSAGVCALEQNIKLAQEEIASANKQLEFLERWGEALTCGTLHPSIHSTQVVVTFTDTYSKCRTELMAKQTLATSKIEQWEKDLRRLRQQKEKLMARVLRRKTKARDERLRKKEEERERLREEGKEDKDLKAPEKWFRVRVWIDRDEEEKTETLERNGSTAGEIDTDVIGELELRYSVSDAGWVSRYDIIINTAGETDSQSCSQLTKPTARLTYHAHFQNRTYETWKDALITLSTSQTTYAGLADSAPVIEPWRIRLVNVSHRYHYLGDMNAVSFAKSRAQAGLYSAQEKKLIAKEKEEEETQRLQMSQQPQMKMKVSAMRSHLAQRPEIQKFTVRKYAASLRLADSYDATLEDRSSFMSLGGGGNAPEEDPSDSEEDTVSMAESATPTLTPSLIDQSATHVPPQPKFVNQGLTSSYSIPKRMTIPSTHSAKADLETSSSAIRRHTILTMPLTIIQLSYVSTPKLRAAAYLKARILNESTTVLRKGLMGVTLDGTFIGSTSLQKSVYPGGVFNLPLGIDESVSVSYAKPSIKRSSQRSTGGKLFSASWGKGQQEIIATYGRSTVIRNNRLDRGPIELEVTDQVPVSEDAKLVVNVTWPRGLKPPPPLVTPAGKRIQEEGEVAPEDGEAGEEGANMKLGVPVKTGTGVYIAGFKVTVDEEPDRSVTRPPTAPQALPVPPTKPSGDRSDDDGKSADVPSFSKSKRSSFFSNLGKGKPSIGKGDIITGPSSSSQYETQARSQNPCETNLSSALQAASRSEEKWGSAVAAMRRNGEVVWKVKLNPGMGVRLGLEYEAKVPAGEAIAGL